MSNQSIVGVWTLLSITATSTRNDKISPYGDEPVGKLIYDASGHMAVVLMRTGRPKFASSDPWTGAPEEIKQAFEGFEAYCGTYDIDTDKGVVTHQVEVSRFPNWEGTAQRRYFQLSGNHLLLKTPPIHLLGQEWVVEVTWQQAGS
jgi:hypothetical protein